MPKKITIFKHINILIGGSYLLIWIILSVFAYFFIPDNSPNANRQLLELSQLPPMSKATLLCIPNPNTQQNYYIPLATNKVVDFQAGKNITFQTLRGINTSFSLDKFSPESQENAAVFIEKNIIHTTFYMGTDSYGRDVWSRLVLGGRISLLIGLCAMFLSVIIGTSIGLIAGYFGGKVDALFMWLMSVVWAIPSLLLAIVLGVVMKRGLEQVMLAIALSTWVEVARMVRGQVMSVKAQPYIEATKALGLGTFRIFTKHLLPNIWSPIIIMATANFGSAILIESGLSFLGMGVSAETPTWGRMIYEGYTFIVFEYGKWLAIFPGIALILLVISMNMIGNGLRDSLE